MNQEMLEILIGKYLDSEITPAEQWLLDAELSGNPESRRLLQQYQRLWDQTREAFDAGIVEAGQSAQEIFETAYAGGVAEGTSRTARPLGWLRFAAGLAAGVMIGWGAYFILSDSSSSNTSNTYDMPSRPPAVIAERQNEDKPTIEFLKTEPRQTPSRLRVVRNVDWYNFTDESGDEWLVEGYRENTVSPAVYHGDL